MAAVTDKEAAIAAHVATLRDDVRELENTLDQLVRERSVRDKKPQTGIDGLMVYSGDDIFAQRMKEEVANKQRNQLLKQQDKARRHAQAQERLNDEKKSLSQHYELSASLDKAGLELLATTFTGHETK